MKKIIMCAATIAALSGTSAYAACTATTKTYTACKPGYYLSSGDCLRCPSSGGVYGTSADNNTGGITSCYIPSGNTGSDTTGSFTYTGNCYYSN